MITLKLANGSTLHDVRDDERQVVGYVSDAKNAVGTLDFDIYPKHPAYNAIKAGSTKIRAYRDGMWLHDYTVESVTNDLQLKKHVTATDELQYLERIEVPSYKTGVDGVPQTVSGLFMWLIEYYNARSGNERFAFGHIEGDIIDPTTTLDRSSDSPATVASIVKDKIIDSMGGYVRVRRDNGVLTIDLKADAAGVCSQYIEFGENLVDYADEQDASELYTAVTAESKYKDDNGDEVTITLADAPDGDYLTGYVKQGDTVTNTAAAAAYGVRRKHLSFDGIKNVYTLIDNCESYIAAHCEPVTTVNVSASDLSILDSNVQSFDVGLYTRVKAAPMGFDAAFECQSAKRSLNDPTDDKYTLGWTWGSASALANQRAVEALLGIGQAVRATDDLRADVKQNAELATDAKTTSQNALDKADTATQTASTAKDTAENAAQTATEASTTATTAKNTADAASATATSASTTANAANATANEAQSSVSTLRTMISETAAGIYVAKLVNGVRSGFAALVNANGSFDVLDSSDATVASFGASLVEIGKNAVSSIIKLCDGKASIRYERGTGYTIYESAGSVAVLANSGSVMMGVGSSATAVDEKGIGMVSSGTNENAVIRADSLLFNGYDLGVGYITKNFTITDMVNFGTAAYTAKITRSFRMCSMEIKGGKFTSNLNDWQAITTTLPTVTAQNVFFTADQVLTAVVYSGGMIAGSIFVKTNSSGVVSNFWYRFGGGLSAFPSTDEFIVSCTWNI